jgi:hypothetical protein
MRDLYVSDHTDLADGSFAAWGAARRQSQVVLCPSTLYGRVDIQGLACARALMNGVHSRCRYDKGQGGGRGV